MVAPFVPPAPEPDALIAWPEAWGTRFLVTVDTEEEFDWTRPLARTGHGTEAMMALPEAHARFAGAGVPLVYLIDYPIATDRRAPDVFGQLLADGRSCIGAQLHPWVNPPFDEELNPVNSFTGNLPISLEAAKLDALGAAVTGLVGEAPKIYRAGRYGIGPNTLALLAERGYRADTSVRSRYDYRADGGPDFGAIGNAAYRCGPGRALFELPLTTVYTGWLRHHGEPLYRTLAGLPKGQAIAARSRALARVSLTPEAMPLSDACEAVRIAVGSGERLLHFAFHSPTIVPGNTPYVRDARELADFYRWWEMVFALLDRLGAAPATLDEVLAAA